MEHPYTNKLIEESSPYLLQHAHNPVDWYPWGEEALEKAKKEKKLILISIGYSSCHWCHVMEHESFEDTTVAAFMNEHFINIKVDREERPDIDDVYMTACQLSSGGNCGWPLNSFALPDGRPVWAGTYFPKLKWLDVLEYFRKTWAEEGDKLEDYGNRLVSGVRDNGLDSILADAKQAFSVEDVHTLAKQSIYIYWPSSLRTGLIHKQAEGEVHLNFQCQTTGSISCTMHNDIMMPVQSNC